VHVYLDDWLFLSQDRLALEIEIPVILTFLESLGFLVNLKKSRLVVRQIFEYLGVQFDTSLPRVRPADHLIQKTILAGSSQNLHSSLTPRRLMQVIGLFNSVADFVHLGRLHLRPIQHWLSARWHQSDGDLDVLLTLLQSPRI
jgi:uncharacterized membrane protein YjgN (DUF898 family)